MTFTIGETNIGSETMISSDKFHKHRYIYIYLNSDDVKYQLESHMSLNRSPGKEDLFNYCIS